MPRFHRVHDAARDLMPRQRERAPRGSRPYPSASVRTGPKTPRTRAARIPPLTVLGRPIGVDEPVDNRWITRVNMGVTRPFLWMNKESESRVRRPLARRVWQR